MRKLPYYLAGFIIAGFIAGSYLMYYRLHYVSAPGGDLYNHVLIMRELHDQGIRVFFRGYPKLFHLILLITSNLTGQSPLKVMLAFVPLVVSSAGLVAFLILNRLRGAWAGLLALVLTVLVARQPLQTLYDGGFPDYISVAIWLPLGILGLIAHEQGEKRKGLVLMITSTVLMILTHHFSTLYVVVLGICVVIFAGKKAWRWLPAVIAAPIIFLISPLGSGARGLFDLVAKVDWSFPWIHFVGGLNDPNALLPLRAYPDYFTPVIWWFGLATIVGIILARAFSWKVPRAIQALALFTVILLVCSQVAALRFPIRIARDAGVFLGLLAAYGVATLVSSVARNRATQLAAGGLLILVLAPYMWQRLDRLSHFENTMQYTPAQDTLAAHTAGQPTVALDQYLPSVPYPTIAPLIADGVLTQEYLQDLDRSRFVLMVETNDGTQAAYEKALGLLGFTVLEKATDPLKTVRLYEKTVQAPGV